MSITTIAGNLTADPELRFTKSGTPVANLTIASTPRRFDKETGSWKDGDTLFLRGTVFGKQAEAVTEKLTKGQRVVATGTLSQSTYEDKDGVTRTSIELQIDEMGESLRFASAHVEAPAPASEPVAVTA